MRILFICNEYPPGKSGGIGSITRNLARQLSAMGHQVFVAGLYLPGYGGKDYEEDQGIRIWRKRFGIDKGLIRNDYSLSDNILLKLFRTTGITQWDTRKTVLSFFDFLQQLIREHDIQVVEWPDFNEYFTNLPAQFQWPPVKLAVPLIVKFHGTASYINHQLGDPIDSKVYDFERQHLLQADTLVSVSRNTADNYQSFYKIDRPVQVLYNSIDLPDYLYDAAGATPTIVFTGTLTRLKGIYSLLRAWNIVHEKLPNATLRIFGKGKAAPLLKELTPSAAATVHFEGFVSRDTLYAAMSKASGAIFPSFTECFALAPLEAMAVGCPVIYTSRVSGPELITSGTDGSLIDPDDYQQMADAMLTLLQDAETRRSYSSNGRRRIEDHFTITQSAKDHINLYNQVISRQHDPPPIVR